MSSKGFIDCIICAYPIDGVDRMVGFGDCIHENVCSICYYRMRNIQNNMSCPNCKAHLDVVICTDISNPKRFHDYEIWGNSIGPEFTYDEKSRMFFTTKYHSTKINPLNLLKCTVCATTRRDIKSLRHHLNSDHNLVLCGLCTEFKQSFVSELKYYTQHEYEQHLRSGDADGNKGHPLCLFCRARYYDVTMLFNHLTKDHYSCFLCERSGLRFKYYNQYNEMENHFRKIHFICEEKMCLDKRFIVFTNEIDLMSHQRQWHPMMQIKNTIPLHFNVRRAGPIESSEGKVVNYDDSLENSNDQSTSRKNNRFDGGIGGRIIDGGWQVEFPPSVVDPRGENRNIQFSSDFNVITQNDLMEYGASTDNGSNANGQPSGVIEDFPALPTTMNGSVPLTTNRWVSVRGGVGDGSTTTGSSAKEKSIKKKKEDYPALPSSNKRNNDKNGTKKPVIKGELKIIADSVMDDDVSSTARSLEVNLLDGWGRVKTDKRLQSSTVKKAVTVPDKPLQMEDFPSLGNGSSKVNNSRMSKNSNDQESMDLAKALAASMIDSYSPASTAVMAQVTESASPEALPDPPPRQNTQVLSIEELISAGAFPALSADSTSEKKTSQKITNGQKSVSSKKSDLNDVLKSVGMTATRKKSTSGFSVVKLNTSANNSNKSLSQLDKTNADLDNLRPIGKLSNDLGIANNGPPPGFDFLKSQTQSSSTQDLNSSSRKGYSGWATIGGVDRGNDSSGKNEARSDNGSQVSSSIGFPINVEDFPSLSGSTNSSGKSNKKNK